MVAVSFAQNWQTTHTENWHSSGNCILQSNSIKITVNALMLDVEEEATILTTGTVNNGDPSTLEIFGTFSTTPGTVIRSMLLWNGNTILKAKLKDRISADSAYEAVVDRDAARFIPRDPAIIEAVGSNQYRYKIYPVSINASRKIRILYSVPMQASRTSPFYGLQTLFAPYAYYPRLENIAVKIVNSPSALGSYLIRYGSVTKTIQFGATYLIPSSNLYNNYYNAGNITITKDTTNLNSAYSFHCSTGNTAGYYTAVFAKTPKTLTDFVSQLSTSTSYNYELKITTGSDSIAGNVPYIGSLGVSMKSATPWNHKLYWTAYDATGHIAAKYTQTIVPDSTSEATAAAPLFWSSKYCFKQNSGSFGALYGFVDRQMSLLALESDTLGTALSSQYRSEGVPPLLPEDIFIRAANAPVTPQNSVIFEFQSTSIKPAAADATKPFLVTVLANGNMSIQTGSLFSGTVEVRIYDLSGRLVYNKSLSISGSQLQLKLPAALKGAFVMRVVAGKEVVNRKIMLR